MIMNLSRMTLCTQDLRKQSAELMRCADSEQTERQKNDLMLMYHVTFDINADDRRYTTHTQVRSKGAGNENEKVLGEITSHTRDMDMAENTVNALLAVPCTHKTRVYVSCVQNGMDLPIEIHQMRYGDVTDMQTLQCEFAMLHDGYNHLILNTVLPNKKDTVRFMVQLHQTRDNENVAALMCKGSQSPRMLDTLQTKVHALMHCTQPLSKLIQRNFVQTLTAVRSKLDTLETSLTQMLLELSRSGKRGLDSDIVSLLTASENIDWNKSWEVQGILQPRMLRNSQSVHTILRELSDDSVENAVQLLGLQNGDQINVQELLESRHVLCDTLQAPRRELSEVVNRRAMWVTLGAIDDVLRRIVTNTKPAFGTYLPYKRYAFELRQMAHNNDTNSEQLSEACREHCTKLISLGETIINSVCAHQRTALLSFDVPVVQCAWEGVLLRGLTDGHSVNPAHGQFYEYSTQNVYDLQKHENVAALEVLRSNLSAENFANRKQAVLMMTAIFLRDENHRIISRNLARSALDCLLHASTSSVSIMHQQQILDVLCLPAKKLMLQALGVEDGSPNVDFMQNAEMHSMYNCENRNELQLMLLVNTK